MAKINALLKENSGLVLRAVESCLHSSAGKCFIFQWLLCLNVLNFTFKTVLPTCSFILMLMKNVLKLPFPCFPLQGIALVEPMSLVTAKRGKLATKNNAEMKPEERGGILDSCVFSNSIPKIMLSCFLVFVS